MVGLAGPLARPLTQPLAKPLTSPQGGGVPAWEMARRTAPVVASPTGGTIYVSGTSPSALPAGNDTTGDGSAAAPYATLTKAMSVISTDGNVLVRCDGTFSENTASGGRWVLNKVFTAKVVFDSYSADPANFIITNASGTSGVVSIRGFAAENIDIRRATIRSSTDGNSLFQSNPDASNHKGAYLLFFDCVMEGRTGASQNLTTIDLRTDNGVNALHFVRCNWKRVAGGDTTNDPQIISNQSVTATIDNQPYSDIGFWDCTTEGNWRAFTSISNGLTGVAKFTVVRCTFATVINYTLLIGKDTAGDTVGKCTNVYIQGCTLTASGSNAHGLVIGSNVKADGDPSETDGVTVKDCTIISGLQGIVCKGSGRAFVKSNVINLTAAAGTPSALYAKAATNTKFRDNVVNLDGASFACYGFREDIDGSTKSSNTELSGNRIAATGANATALLWAGSAGSTGGAVSNDNNITLSSSAALGSVRGTTVASLAALQAAWTSAGLAGDVSTNDSRTLVA